MVPASVVEEVAVGDDDDRVGGELTGDDVAAANSPGDKSTPAGENDSGDGDGETRTAGDGGGTQDDVKMDGPQAGDTADIAAGDTTAGDTKASDAAAGDALAKDVAVGDTMAGDTMANNNNHGSYSPTTTTRLVPFP